MDHVGRSILGSFAALAVLVAALSACSSTMADRDVIAVQAVVTDTILAGQRIGVMPGGGVVRALTAADVDLLASDAEAAARDHYAGPLLATMLEQFKAAVADAAKVGDPPSALDGGIKDVQIDETTVRADTAAVRLRATLWLAGAQGDIIATPSGTADFTFELAKVDGRWYVTAESFDFLPGQGP